jgi:hypothetical protein
VFAPRLWPGREGGASVASGVGVEDKQAEADIRRLYDREHDVLLRRDFAAQEQFYPDDFVVTNPFSMFVGKPKVRIGDILSFSKESHMSQSATHSSLSGGLNHGCSHRTRRCADVG